ncbi:hypothetical protein [Streptosporangium canum]
MIDWSKHPSECTEAERWERFNAILAEGLVEAWQEGRLVLPEREPSEAV